MSEDNMINEVLSRKVVDADLDFLVEIANKLGSFTGVTLFSKGLVITGVIISGKEYYESVANSFKPDREGNIGLGAYFRKVGANAYTDDEDEDKSFPSNFMHLKDVKILTGNGNFSPLNNAFLRLKIEEIDGHIIGIASN